MFTLFFWFFVGSFLLSSTAAFLLKISSRPKDVVSHSGGIAIWSSFLFVSLFALLFFIAQISIVGEFFGIFICSTLIFIVGLVDDRIELSALSQFLVQLAIGIIVIIFGVKTQIVGIGLAGNVLVTLFWILGITNAFNHLDIVDGLSASVAFVCTTTFFIFAILTLNVTVAIIFAILAGAILGFLRYNLPPAKIYMGNSGSHFLGFLLSTLAIMIDYATLDKVIALVIPILILGFPIFDTLFVIWMRHLKGIPIWKKSNDHIVLRLIASGYSNKKAVIFILTLASLFSVCAVAILQLPKLLGIIILLLLFLVCASFALRIKKVIVDG